MDSTKGTFYILLSNIVFVLSGYAIYFGLARMLGPGLYGNYGVVVSLVSTINTVLILSIQQSVSKFVSEDRQNALAVRNTALKVQGVIVVFLFLVYMSLSGLIAQVFNDLGGDFSAQVEGDEVVVVAKRCPWGNEARRNPVTCMLTKSVSARFAKRAWGGAKVHVTKTLANKDDCCRIVIKKSG